LEGHSVRPELLPADLSAFEAARLFGWTLTEFDQQPFRRTQWLIAMAQVREATIAKKERQP
jgi:hypothetical protein